MEQGNIFEKSIFDKIKNKFPNLEISIDGSVNSETAAKLVEAGATRLVIGSALFGAVDILSAIREFEML